MFSKSRPAAYELAKESSSRQNCLTLSVLMLLALPLLDPGWLSAATPSAGFELDQTRHFDARSVLAVSTPKTTQLEAAQEQRNELPELAVTYDSLTGVTRSVFNRIGYLTAPAESLSWDPLEVALTYLRAQHQMLGLTLSDLDSYEITDHVDSELTGATHLYFRQRAFGIPVYNAQLQVHINRDGRVLSVNNAFVPDLAQCAAELEAQIGAGDAVLAAAGQIGIGLKEVPRTTGSTDKGGSQFISLDAAGISTKAIEARLMLLPVAACDVRLVWNFQIFTPGGHHAFDFTVDAVFGEVWTRTDWVAGSEYKVYPMGVESPLHANPMPPIDGRQVHFIPADDEASPFGWHDLDGFPGPEHTTLEGNNVSAYEDIDANNIPSPNLPDCGPGLTCDFAIHLNQDPHFYSDASVANLFYWNNYLHDVLYPYGFDEAAGNFQNNNYGHSGHGNDAVRAEGQDGASTNFASFLTPPDGAAPRMQVGVWNTAFPARDGALDSGIIIHEYLHGVTNRLVGGPNNTSCLGNQQQPSEGISDWWALALTHLDGDQGEDPRGIGNYVANQPLGTGGLRSQPYSTDQTISSYTYSSISNLLTASQIGEVWGQAAWDVYWTLVKKHTFDDDFYNAGGDDGNLRALLYSLEGLKNTSCSPTFTDVRDGMIQAAIDNYGGEDVCLMWKAFAARGLGVDAVSGGPNSLTVTDGFAFPVACEGQVKDGCSGPCSGKDKDAKELSGRCSSQTTAAKDAAMDEACGNVSKKGAREDANAECLECDDTGTCLCTGGNFPAKAKKCRSVNRLGGKVCRCTCRQNYEDGSCNTVKLYSSFLDD